MVAVITDGINDSNRGSQKEYIGQTDLIIRLYIVMVVVCLH